MQTHSRPQVLPAELLSKRLGDLVTPAAFRDQRRDVLNLVAQWGRSPVSPFLPEPDNTLLCLAGGGAAGYRPVRQWAVFPTEAAAPPGLEREALDSLLIGVSMMRRRPVFAAVSDPEPYRARGMYSIPIADDACIDLTSFSLAGKRMASLRHSVTSARRAGLEVVPYSPEVAAGVERVSAEWLAQKRGGELGFTLGKFEAAAVANVECRVAVDGEGRVAGFVTWRRYDDGHARVLDIMRRAADAPNPTMDLLIGSSLLEFAAAGISVASLGAVPRSQGRTSERIYPTVSLRKYKEKFAPTWVPQSLIAPSRSRLPGALLAVASAYCPGGLGRALTRNG